MRERHQPHLCTNEHSLYRWDGIQADLATFLEPTPMFRGERPRDSLAFQFPQAVHSLEHWLDLCG